MSEVRTTYLRKRQHSEPPHTNGDLQIESKKRKLNRHSTESPLRAAFWDNLSRIWLTKRALRELDRRNTQLGPSKSLGWSSEPLRPVVLRGSSFLKKDDWLFQSATEFLRRCTPTCRKKIKSFARHGGPDLSDLKGVRFIKTLSFIKANSSRDSIRNPLTP